MNPTPVNPTESSATGTSGQDAPWPTPSHPYALAIAELEAKIETVNANAVINLQQGHFPQAQHDAERSLQLRKVLALVKGLASPKPKTETETAAQPQPSDIFTIPIDVISAFAGSAIEAKMQQSKNDREMEEAHRAAMRARVLMDKTNDTLDKIRQKMNAPTWTKDQEDAAFEKALAMVKDRSRKEYLKFVAEGGSPVCRHCANAHAVLDADESRIIRNTKDGYPEGREDKTLTLAERVAALCRYAADWKRRADDPKITAAEAVFGFASWLTTREEATTMSSHSNSGEAAELVGIFCRENKLGAPRKGWENNLIHPSGECSHGNAETPDLHQPVWNEKEIAAIKELAKMKDVSTVAVVRQALRQYHAVAHGACSIEWVDAPFGGINAHPGGPSDLEPKSYLTTIGNQPNSVDNDTPAN